MWASQLLTLRLMNSSTKITFNFTDNIDLVRIEVVMFNCPQWEIGVQNIAVRENMTDILSKQTGDITSCDYLVKTCIMARFSSPSVSLKFNRLTTSRWVHLAEVTFHTSTSECPPDTIITHAEETATTPAATTPNTDGSGTAPTPTAGNPTAETSSDGSRTAAIPTAGNPTAETSSDGSRTAAIPTAGNPTAETSSDGSRTAAIPTAGNSAAETTSETAQTDVLPTSGFPVTIIIITAIPVILVLMLIVAVAVILLCCWRCKQKHRVKEEASHSSGQISTHTHQAINLQEVRSTPEEHDHTSLHIQRNEEDVSGNNSDGPEYSVVATEHPVSEAELIESENPSDHLHDQVDGKRKKEKARTQQQTPPFEDEDHLYDETDKKNAFAHPKSATKKKNHRQSKSSPPKTDYHDEDHDSTLQEGQLYAQVDKSGKKKNHAQESPKLPASQENWLYQDGEHDLIAVREQVTSEDHSYDRVEWNVGNEKESATSECQFHNKLEEGAGAASKQKVEPLQREDSKYYQVDMSYNSFAETPEEYFHLRHHEKSVPYFEENSSFSVSGTDQGHMYAQLEESNAKDVPRQQTAPHTMTERSQDHLYAEPEGGQGTKFPRKHTKPHVKSHHQLHAEVEKKVRANQTGPPPQQDDLYSQIEDRKVQTKSASLLRKSHDDRFTQPEEREARTPSDQPQDHLYTQPDKKKVRAKSSSLLSKSHDNLYSHQEERDVHTHLASFASLDRLRKSHDHLYAELEEGKASKASKESTSCGSGKPQTHEYAELEESAQPSSLSSQTSHASLKSKKPQAHVYAQLEEGEMHAQPSPLPPEELLYAEPEERRATKKHSTLPPLRGGKPHTRLYSQVEERDMQTQLSSLPPEELLYAEPEERRATKKHSTLPPLRGGKPHTRLYSQVEERDMQTQLSSLPPEELLYAKPEKRKATKKCSTLPPLKGCKPQAHLYAQLEERGASNVRTTPPTTPVSSTPSNHLYAQLEERETSGVCVGQSTTSLDLRTQFEEEDTSDIRSTPPPAM